LKKVYAVPARDIFRTLSEFLEMETIHHPEQDVVIKALEIFGEDRLDFVDCILIALNHLRGERIASFDKALVRQHK
jgi:predicted nucleic acid-binding protein